MAFQQPIHAPSHPVLATPETREKAIEAVPTHLFTPADAQEWVLFPTTQRPSTSLSRTASTRYTPQTAGLSRLSEFGSFDTAAHSGPNNGDDDALADDEDLDSLDENLHAFHDHLPGQEATYIDHNASILPTHDGLGTFPGSSALVQEHLWQFEQANPQRKSLGHNRRRSSVQRKLDALEHDDGLRMEKERMDRIERWRLEHSRMLLEEVEKQSRRRASHQLELPTASTLNAAKEAIARTGGTSPSAAEGTRLPAVSADAGNTRADDATPWYRLVQGLLYDLIGLDENVLSIMFGEALAVESQIFDTCRRSRERPSQSLALQPSPPLILTLINRLSRELVSILRRFSYTPAVVPSPLNRMTLDYAGIPVAETCGHQLPGPPVIQHTTSEAGTDSTPNPLFNPTLEEGPRSPASEFGHAALWGIEEEPAGTLSATQDQEYWEQTPSIRTIFRLLQQHFTARRPALLSPSNCSSSVKPSNVATTTSATTRQRASVIRQHHPLVSRQHKRRTATITRHYSGHSIPNLSSPLFKRAEGSCASISSRKSKRGSGSSRNYWDLGGSIGSGSVGGMGIWGEV